MKNKILLLLSSISLLGMLTYLSACNNGSNGRQSTANNRAQICSTPGHVYTQRGCLPQCPNNPGYAIYNGQCSEPVLMNNQTSCGTPGYVNTQYGCLPQCPNNPGYAVYNGQCSVPVYTGASMCPTPGYVNTQYGCLPQCPNYPGFAMMNGQCSVPVTGFGTNGINNFGNGYYNGNYYNGYNNGYYNTSPW